MSANPFSDIERQAWAPPERIGAAEWTERYRVLGPRVTATPGPMRLSRIPYARGILDALSDREHRKVVLVSSAQWGKSEIGRCWMGWAADTDPGPMLVVFPSETACKETMAERIIPMFDDSPKLRKLLTGRTWDKKNSAINLRSCSIYTGWSGSPQALASRPIRYVNCDEVENFAAYTGKQGDAVSQAMARMLSFGHRGKAYLSSTPKLPTGPITRAYEACEDRRSYWILCKPCNELVEPTWEQVRFAGKEATSEDDIRASLLDLPHNPATLQCPKCEGHLLHADVWWGVVRGEWVSEGCPPGERPAGESVGFKGSGLVSPWVGVDRLASGYLRARLTGLGELQDWHHSMLGAPFWGAEMHGDDTLRVDAATVRMRAEEGGEPGVIPEWALVVVVGVDTAQVGHQFVVRAFGEGYRSKLLAYGEVRDEAALLEVAFREWPREGGGATVRARRLCVDAGGANRRDRSRTEEVYRLASTDPAHIWPVKGLGGAGEALQPVKTSVHTYAPPGRPKAARDVKLSVLDTGYFKDLLASQIVAGIWSAHRSVRHDYVSQVASERKILVETRVDPRTGKSRDIWRWQPVAVGAANHYWDAEVYALAAAYTLGVGRVDMAREGAARTHAPAKASGGWKIGR